MLRTGFDGNDVERPFLMGVNPTQPEQFQDRQETRDPFSPARCISREQFVEKQSRFLDSPVQDQAHLLLERDFFPAQERRDLTGKVIEPVLVLVGNALAGKIKLVAVEALGHQQGGNANLAWGFGWLGEALRIGNIALTQVAGQGFATPVGHQLDHQLFTRIFHGVRRAGDFLGQQQAGFDVEQRRCHDQEFTGDFHIEGLAPVQILEVLVRYLQNRDIGNIDPVFLNQVYQQVQRTLKVLQGQLQV